MATYSTNYKVSGKKMLPASAEDYFMGRGRSQKERNRADAIEAACYMECYKDDKLVLLEHAFNTRIKMLPARIRKQYNKSWESENAPTSRTIVRLRHYARVIDQLHAIEDFEEEMMRNCR